MSLHTVSVDNDLMQQIDNDHTYEEYKRFVSKACCKPVLGKVIYARYYPQALIWKSEKRLAMKMSTVYLTAKVLLVERGLPKELLDVADEMFGKLKGRLVSSKLKKSVRFISVAWHMRMIRTFHLLLGEFYSGKNVVSYGCGSGIIELLALLAS